MSMNIGRIGGLDLTALYEDIFKKVDSNGDGSIDKAEFKTAVSGMAKDQNVDDEEADKMFSRLDTDGDGKVSQGEMLTALKTAGEQMHAHMPPPPPDGPRHGENETLTEGQKTTADSILSQYDASNLTSDDVKAINQAIGDAGIRFGRALGDEIEAQGFNIQTMMSLSLPPVNGDNNSSSVVISDASTNQKGIMTGESALFSDLIKSLKSSDSNENDIFSEFIKSLNSSNQSNEDQITSLLQSLITDLQNSTKYSNQGSVSYSLNTTQSLLSVYA